MESKEQSYIEVMKHIPDGATIGTTSFGIGGLPEQLVDGLGQYYKKHGHPKDITFATTAGIGVGPERGLDHLIAPGLLKRVVASYIATSPLANQAAQKNAFEMYSIPQGMIGKLYQNAAGQGPGVFSKVGLGSFVDPSQHGGKLNKKARDSEDLVERVNLDGEDWLHYKPLPVNVAFIKASYADKNGNLSIKRETSKLESLALATAAYNAGGVVIAQVEEILENHTIPAREVYVPGKLVDYVVLGEEKYHMQTPLTYYSPLYSNEIRVELNERYYKQPLSPRKAIVRRASLELPKDSLVNLGNGMSSHVSEIIAESGLIEDYHLTTDMGAMGGMTATGYDYASNINADAVLNTLDMFNLYHGNGLDATVLGFGQMDEIANMNTTKLGNTIVGPGGMMDITHGSDKIIFIGTFVVKGKTKIEDGKLVIEEEGKASKFVSNLPYITFSSQNEHNQKKEIIVITDRAVFDRSENGRLRLIEIAPGLDLEKDILDWMEFKPEISENLKEMDAALFQEDWLLKDYHPDF